MHKLIQFRDQGCQGAKSIINNAVALIKNEQTFEAVSHNAKRLVYVAPSNNTNEKTNVNINIWKELAEKFSLEFATAQDALSVTSDDIVVFDEAYATLAEDMQEDKAYAVIVDANQNEFVSHYALPSMATIAFLALRSNKPLYEISISWIGDAGTLANELPIAMLEASICTLGYYGFAFENSPMEMEKYLPNKPNLDFAMGAGSKIFLTHEPTHIDADADLLYIAPWTFLESKNLKPQSHPFTYDSIREAFNKETQIVSLIPEVESSKYDEELLAKASYTVRQTTLSYILSK